LYEEIFIFSFSANFFASLLGLTLNAIKAAFDAFARVTSVSVTIPMSAKIIFGLTSSCLIWLIAFLMASDDPWTSDLIIKSDVHGSSEAIKNAIGQIKHDEVKPKIILADIGMVTETDVTLAKASNAVLIAFNVKPSKEAKKLAENEKIKISSYNIIYEVLDYIKQKMSGLLSPDIQETVTGTAQILEIFKVSGAGKVAGSKVMEGEITTTSDVRIIRDGAIIYTGKVGTLFREKNQVKQVSNGQECGITVKDYMDFQKNDTIEAFSVTSTERMI